ncbi:death-on-curing family protein [Sphingomonas sp. NFR04]|uniref:type II toxin-antitoxin system death-on-curing family toxin n=1 Tax=Sphingomonas sp. NFR04 TaxID=1566283 RepID=UPI0008EC8C89|nr:type II toxin-antitoxin system death-on-curing family toxin [Sphingomonas sp. NFR04]SFJ47121.1 death-on-curing family protein [Sphingomonas sp. NFR04]
MSEPLWLTTSEIIEINARIVARTEEPSFVKDWPALESAADRPRNAYGYGQDDIAYLAAMTCVAIAQNHPFMQGNKRTALIGMQVFLQNNGYSFNAPDVREVSQLIYDVVEHRLDVDGLADRFDPWIEELGEGYSGMDLGDLIAGMPAQSFSIHFTAGSKFDGGGEINLTPKGMKTITVSVLRQSVDAVQHEARRQAAQARFWSKAKKRPPGDEPA